MVLYEARGGGKEWEFKEVGLLMKEEIRAYWLIQLTKKKRVSMIFNQIANGKGKIAIAVALYL